MPDLDDREQIASRSHLLSDLDRLAERLIVLDEVANGADPSLLAPLVGVRQDELAAWRARYAWNIEGFFKHYRQSPEYSEEMVAKLLALGDRLLKWAGTED